MAQSNPTEERRSRHRRLKTMPLPPEEENRFLWRHDQPALKDLTKAEQVALFVKTRTWREVVRPFCEEIDRQTRGRRGPKREYSAEHLEIALLYGRAFGTSSPERIRELLSGDLEPSDVKRGRLSARELLGFTGGKPRHNQKHLVGVPSVRTLRRHRARMTDERRAQILEAAHKDLVQLFLENEDVHDDCRTLYMDGTSIFTRHQAPLYDPETKELVNAPVYDVKTKKKLRRDPKTGKRLPRPVTAPEAGYRADGLESHPGGSGWQTVALIQKRGVPLAFSDSQAQVSERPLGERNTDYYAAEILPKLRLDDPRLLSVLTTDSNFYSRAYKGRLQEVGILPNIPRHKRLTDGEASDAGAALNDVILPLRGTSWHTNGHYEIACNCGRGRLAKRAFRDQQGRAVVSVEGTCETCGSVTVQAGRWRRAKNAPVAIKMQKQAIRKTLVSRRRHAGEISQATYERELKKHLNGDYLVRVQPGDPPEQAEWSCGNFLTFNSDDAAEYADDRFGYNEAFNRALGRRFGVGEEPCWHRGHAAVTADTAQAMCLIVVLSIEQAAWESQEARRSVSDFDAARRKRDTRAEVEADLADAA